MKKYRIKHTVENMGLITEPGKELKEWFNLRARDKSKEIVPSFGLRLKPSILSINERELNKNSISN